MGELVENRWVSSFFVLFVQKNDGLELFPFHFMNLRKIDWHAQYFEHTSPRSPALGYWLAPTFAIVQYRQGNVARSLALSKWGPHLFTLHMTLKVEQTKETADSKAPKTGQLQEGKPADKKGSRGLSTKALVHPSRAKPQCRDPNAGQSTSPPKITWEFTGWDPPLAAS